MEQLEGRVAVITGGGSGIGEGIAHACREAGMKVVVADIEVKQAERVAADLRAAGGQAVAAQTDVSRRESVEALAERAYREFGAVHLLFNNAGVMMVAPLADSREADWQWTLGVNLWGPVNGIAAFLPRMRAGGQEGHIVNTASIAGLRPIPDIPIGVYTASKYALVAVSETLVGELAAEGIHVSVVCPGGVATGIFTAERNRPREFGGPVAPQEASAAAEGDDEPGPEMMDPREAGRRILEGVRANRLYIFTHPAERTAVEARFQRIMADFDAAW